MQARYLIPLHVTITKKAILILLAKQNALDL